MGLMCNVDGERPYGPAMPPAPLVNPAPVLARRSGAFIPRPIGRPNVGFPGYVNPGIRRSFVPQPVLSQSYVGNPGVGVPTVRKVMGAPGVW